MVWNGETWLGFPRQVPRVQGQRGSGQAQGGGEGAPGQGEGRGGGEVLTGNNARKFQIFGGGDGGGGGGRRGVGRGG